ncbi:hypothetical protein NMG60_11022932 [Bertholletia excelsa]
MAATFGSCTLEVTIISGEDLRAGRRGPLKKNAFVTVWTIHPNCRATTVDSAGGTWPTWNEKLVLDMPAGAKSLMVEVHYRTRSGNRLVGSVRVPSSDFSCGYLPEDYLHFLSYRLRDDGGEPNGIINLSVRKKAVVSEVTATATPSCSAQPWMGAPAAENVRGAVVTGVPVWRGSR